MIDLSRQQPFASGGNRHCYVHPAFADRCVKVMLPGRIEQLRRRAAWYKAWMSDARFDDNAREMEGYGQRVLREADAASPVWQHLPRWYGMVETSEGPGAVSELILDERGAPAMTLEAYLTTHGLDDAIRAALDSFADWLRHTGVLTKNLLPHNLVIRERDGSPSLYLIDGLGSAAFLPLVELFAGSRRRYIERRIQRMWARVQWEVSDRSLTWKQAEKLSRRR
ncbi:YrbL family protein [Microbulbifer sp.]|uniref:YrbL family protein n=1 Tax=Microbulbifer sp. TaxID=1908541 RepID=UPI002584EE54|nr:YrbL family protein [Microbulbifer sp.]